MKIDGSEATFDVNLIGSNTNQTYMGTFKVKCLLSPLEDVAADKAYREMLGEHSHLAHEHTRQLAWALTQLDKRVISSPPFWANPVLGGGHIEDHNVILEVIDMAIEAQAEYIKLKKQELEDKQRQLTEMIKKKHIEKEPEVESVDDEDPDEIDLE